MGDAIRGRKVAFSLSPGWFFTEIFDPKYYEGNFSEMQAAEVAFSDSLSHELKRDIARRMLEFPKTLDGRDFLAFALQKLAARRPARPPRVRADLAARQTLERRRARRRITWR